MKRFQTIADTNAVLHFAVLRKLGLEGFQLGAHDEPARVHYPVVGGIKWFSNRLVQSTKVKKWNLH
jgi:hypothetical protein